MKPAFAVAALVAVATVLGTAWSCGRRDPEGPRPASAPQPPAATRPTTTTTTAARANPAHTDHAIAPSRDNPLLELFLAHGVECKPGKDGKSVVFPSPAITADWSFAHETRFPNAVTVELNVRFLLDDGRTLAEWFAGIGRDRDEAERDAWYNFASNMLHVLLAALFRTAEPDDQIEREVWVVGGRTRNVVVGPGTCRGVWPEGLDGPSGFFAAFEAAVKRRPLPPGMHWARLYYARPSADDQECEVLLDSETWKEVQNEMAAYPWPRTDKFYAVRVFLILTDGPKP